MQRAAVLAKQTAAATKSWSPLQNRDARLIQRKCACGGTPGPTGECEACRKKWLQRRSAQPSTLKHQHSEVPPIVHEVLRSPGQPLDQATRAFFEPRFGHNFGEVRVHTDARAAESAQEVNAVAYTIGRDVVLGAGQYAPTTGEGQRLLAHELAHVVQQSVGKTSDALDVRIETNHAAEAEAERVAKYASRGQQMSVRERPQAATVLARQQVKQVDEVERPMELHLLHELHGGAAEKEPGYWDYTARRVFGAASYDAYCASLKSMTFFGATIKDVHEDIVEKFQQAETDLRARKGLDYKPPHADSTLRKRKGMHGWGMAVDFDVLRNPYVLNESGEKELDQELVRAYDQIAQFMLGKNSSDLRKLKGGRAALGGSISAVYDILRAESDAMKRYFSMMNNDEAVRAFLANEWPVLHQGQQPPDAVAVKAAMREAYEVLGGATASGGKHPTGGKGDRPFAPVSSGFQGDPSTGFLNLDKDFVEALTATGLAWGAVDIAGEPGDVQHFDLRLSGIGKRVYDLMLK